MVHRPLRLTLDGDALVANWRWLARQSGSAACGAAVKADAYGLGAREVVKRLSAAGCRDFFVSTWAEAEALMPWPEELALSVLHGVGPDDMPAAHAMTQVRPVLNSPQQVERWRDTGRACDVMIDTGMNRLGLTPADAAGGMLAGLAIETLMSHLACADEDSPENERQRSAFLDAARHIPAKRLSLANSAGVCLGRDYAFDLTRPGLALYGGVPRREAEGHIRQVVHVEAQIVQRRRVAAGERVGYNGTFVAAREHELAVLNIGYADGYLRGFSNRGTTAHDGRELPVAGRISMDLIAIQVDKARELREGDWVELEYDLPKAAERSGLSQYELLTVLGNRFARGWNSSIS